MPITVRSTLLRIALAKPEQARDSEWHAVRDELRLAPPASFHIFQLWRKTILLIGMRRIDQDHASDLTAVGAGESANIVATHGVTHRHVRWPDGGRLKQCMQFLSNYLAGARLRTWIAVANPGTVIGTNPGEAGNLRLHFRPGQKSISETRVKNDRWSSSSDAIDVHLAPIYVH